MHIQICIKTTDETTEKRKTKFATLKLHFLSISAVTRNEYCVGIIYTLGRTQPRKRMHSALKNPGPTHGIRTP